MAKRDSCETHRYNPQLKGTAELMLDKLDISKYFGGKKYYQLVLHYMISAKDPVKV